MQFLCTPDLTPSHSTHSVVLISLWTTSSWLWCAPPAWPVDCLHDHHVNTLEVHRQTQHLDIYLSESTNLRNTAGQSANTLATTGLLECGTWTYRRTDETDQHEYRVLFWKIQLQLKSIPEPKPFGLDCYRFLSFWSRCFCIYCQSDRSRFSHLSKGKLFWGKRDDGSWARGLFDESTCDGR